MSDEFGIRPFWCEFRNADTEKAFLSFNLYRGQSQLKFALALSAMFFFAFSITDIAVLGYTHDSFVLFVARLFVAITASAAIYAIHRKPLSITIPMLVATLFEIAGMGAFIIIAIYRAHEMPWHAMSISIMLIVVYLFIPNRLIYAIGVALASTVIFILLALQFGSLKSSDFLTMSMLLVMTNIFGVIAAHRHHLLWREEYRAQSLLKRLSIQDHLTGCYNRRHLDSDILGNEIARARRQNLWLTVILCDLDHFKSVNDTYGHQTGDSVLCKFSTLLKQVTREHIDYAIRLGGEEFLLVLPGTDLTGGVLLAERLRSLLSEKPILQTADAQVNITASFGVVAINFAVEGKAISELELISAADIQLYKAKNSGRNLVKHCEL